MIKLADTQSIRVIHAT